MFRKFSSVVLYEGIRGRVSEGIGLERRTEQASACVKQRGEEEILSWGVVSSNEHTLSHISAHGARTWVGKRPGYHSFKLEQVY